MRGFTFAICSKSGIAASKRGCRNVCAPPTMNLATREDGIIADKARAIRILAIGAIAVGALAVGAVALGALAIGRLSIGRAKIKRLEIDELVIRKRQSG
jgi:hypothetical protein